ncbi:MAG: hypothetical protein QM703_01150 [Gemmatales bacterium]
MRMLLVTFLALGFVLLDVVVIVAMSNMIGWSSVSSDTLFWMLLIAIVGMVVGLVGLRWQHRATLKE